MEVSVIVPCWITEEDILHLTYKCIDSIRTYSDVELILIDNGSILGTDFMLDESDIYVRNKYNIGFTKAVNQGIRLSTQPYILVGNNDVEMLPNNIEELMNVLVNKEDCGAVLPSGSEFDGLTKEGVTGCWWMTSKEIINKVGLLDERFINRFSDFDYVHRLNNAGLECYGTNKAKIIHKGSASLDKMSDGDNDSEYIQSRNRFLIKWRNDPRVRNRLADVMGEDRVNEFFKSVQDLN